MGSDPGLRLVHSREPNDVDLLVGHVARGDSRAFEQLYDEMGASVYGVARRVVRDPSRAEDIAAVAPLHRKTPMIAATSQVTRVGWYPNHSATRGQSSTATAATRPPHPAAMVPRWPRSWAQNALTSATTERERLMDLLSPCPPPW